MSKRFCIPKGLLSEARRFLRKNPHTVHDVIVFGSLMRGKESPSDIDILILFQFKEDRELAYNLRKSMEKNYPKVEVIPKTFESLMSSTFQARETVLWEGYSCRTGQPFAEGFGFFPQVLFKFHFKKISASRRIQFFYSLKGRGGSPGMINRLGLSKFSDGVLACPVRYVEEVRQYLNSWDAQIEEVPVLFPRRLW